MKHLPSALRRNNGELLEDGELAAVVAYAHSRLWGDPTKHWQDQQPKPKDEAEEEPTGGQSPDSTASGMSGQSSWGDDETSFAETDENPVIKFFKAVGAWIAMMAKRFWRFITRAPEETPFPDWENPLIVRIEGDAVSGSKIQIVTLLGDAPVPRSPITINDEEVGNADEQGRLAYHIPESTKSLSIRAQNPYSLDWTDLQIEVKPSDADTQEIEEPQTAETPDDEQERPILVPPGGRIKSIGRVYWTGRVQNVHGAPMLLDNTGTASEQTIDAIQFQGSVDDMLQTSQELRSLLDDPPVVSSRHDSDDDDEVTNVLVSDYELRTYRLLEKLETLLQDTETVSASLPVLSRTSIARALASDADSFANGDAAPAIPSGDATSLESEIERISGQEQMTATDQLRDSFISVRDSVRNGLEELADTRDQSLNEILGRDLDDLIRYYDFPMYDFYCPDCFDRRMDEAGVNLTDEDFQLDQVSAEYIKAAEEKLRASILSIHGDMWVCPLCHWSGEFDAPDTAVPLDADSPRYMHRVWSNLVAPLWERLWSEKSTHDERARIVREKETERRRNLNEEFNELNDLKNEFSMDRRRMQEGLDSLRLSSIRSRELLLSLLHAF